MYQKYEGNLPTLPQKPDTMLSIEKKGRDYSFHYIFDAKYRIDYAQPGSYYQTRYHTPGPMEDDINTMHRYRDAIVVMNNGPYERTAFGAYVLFPWSDEDIYQGHHFYKSINDVNIGAFPFLPNATTLVEQFIERLVESSPEKLQDEGILPRGSMEQWFSDLDEKVLVGLVSTREDYLSFVQEGYYQISVEVLKKGWQEAKYVALYVKNGIADVHGVSLYGRVSNIEFVKDSAKFEVDVWKNLKQGVIRPVHYGIANYAMTTMNVVKEAKELPELFMKSKEEMILWRMLRRVSDQIKVTLNQPNLDEATQIISYSVKDITIELDREKRSLSLNKENEQFCMEVDVMEKYPAKLFKKILLLLSESK